MRQRKPVKITTQQQECINYPSNGDLLVRGIPGSGKTTVLVERARTLKLRGETNILLLSFNAMLSQFIVELSRKTPGEPVEALTFHAWSQRLLNGSGKWPYNGYIWKDDQDSALRQARRAVNARLKSVAGARVPSMPGVSGGADEPKRVAAEIKFLKEELAWLKGLGKDRQRYMDEPRAGRGSSGVTVLRPHREWIWAVFEEYQAILNKRRQVDYDDVALLLHEHRDRIPADRRPNHVLVDEAQDLSAMQLRVIKELARKSVTIAADKGQSIYGRNFSWAGLGIDIRGRSKSLLQTFRSTRQIIQLARSLQRKDPLVLKKDDEYVPGVDPDVDGPPPEVYHADTLAQQMPQVIRWVVRRLDEYARDTIAIIVPTRDWRKKYQEELDRRRIPHVVLIKEERPDVLAPGVKVVTYHSAKGLEFDHVAVTCLRDGTMPARPGPDLSREDQEDFYATERRKVYVAITRARLTVGIFAANPRSQFIAEMDPRLYRVTR